MGQAQHMFLEAYGSLLATLPEVQELLEFRDSMTFLDDQDRRSQVVTKAESLGFSLLTMFVPQVSALPESEMNLPLREVWPLIASLIATRIPDISLREGIGLISNKLFWNDFLVDFIEEYHRTGEPPALYDNAIGGVAWTQIGPVGDRMPVVFAAISPHTPMAELVDDLYKETAEAFKDVPKTLPGTAGEIGRYIHLSRVKKMGNSEIAWLFLSERDEKIASTPQERRKKKFADEYKREMRRLQQMNSRGIKRLTQLSPPVSSESE